MLFPKSLNALVRVSSATPSNGAFSRIKPAPYKMANVPVSAAAAISRLSHRTRLVKTAQAAEMASIAVLIRSRASAVEKEFLQYLPIAQSAAPKAARPIPTETKPAASAGSPPSPPIYANAATAPASIVMEAASPIMLVAILTSNSLMTFFMTTAVPSNIPPSTATCAAPHAALCQSNLLSCPAITPSSPTARDICTSPAPEPKVTSAANLPRTPNIPMSETTTAVAPATSPSAPAIMVTACATTTTAPAIAAMLRADAILMPPSVFSQAIMNQLMAVNAPISTTMSPVAFTRLVAGISLSGFSALARIFSAAPMAIIVTPSERMVL